MITSNLRHAASVLMHSALALMMLGLSSCSSSRPDVISYFQDIDQLPDTVWNPAITRVPHFAPHDELSIIVSSASSPQSVTAFNRSSYIQQQQTDRQVNTLTQLQTYTIDEEGCINFPTLGRLSIAGMTALQLEQMLTQRIREYAPDAQVRVTLLGFSVTVLGEVSRPGITRHSGNRSTLVEALGAAGDLTIYGNRKNIILVREEEGRREKYRIDLTSADLFDSPYYYVQQNDVIYVAPNSSRRDSARYNNMKQQNLSVISTIVGVVSVLVSLSVALFR